MVSREILNSHPITTLRKEIAKSNLKGYDKMKKPELVELMMKNASRFSHIKMNEKAKKKAEPKKKVVKEDSSRLEELLKDDKPKKKPAPKKTEPKKPAPKKAEPKKPAPKKTEPKKKTAEQERRDKLNKMTPEELMNALPDVAKRNVQKFTTNAGDKYRAVVSADMKKYFNISKPNDAQFYSYTPIANKIMGFKSKSDLRKSSGLEDNVEVELGTGKEIEEYFEKEHDISPKEIKQKVDKYINEREKPVKKIPKTFIKYARSKELKKVLEAGIGKGTKIPLPIFGFKIFVPLSINNKEKKMTYIEKIRDGGYNLIKNQSLDKFEKDLDVDEDADILDGLLD